LSVFDLLVYAGWGMFWAYWWLSALRIHALTKMRESSPIRWLVWILLISGFGILISKPVTLGPLSWRFLPDNVALSITGAIILFGGFGLAIWARIHLGQYWSGWVSIKKNHKLIQSGPYRAVRHPIYTGILTAFLGTALIIGEIRVWLAIDLVLTGFLLKIRREEGFLLKEFGLTFLRYKKKVKMLIPLVL
jgi:protein-S-isoprenylcysteine O-methyltransferase Ste14